MKQDILNEIIKHQKELIAQLEDEIKGMQNSADLDEDGTIDLEDLSHQSELGEMKRHITSQLQKAISDLKEIETLNTGQKSVVEVGALVHTKELLIFIGVATIPFKYKNQLVYGISTDAPIYSFLKGKKAGDTVKYPTKNMTILDVE